MGARLARPVGHGEHQPVFVGPMANRAFVVFAHAADVGPLRKGDDWHPTSDVGAMMKGLRPPLASLATVRDAEPDASATLRAPNAFACARG